MAIPLILVDREEKLAPLREHLGDAFEIMHAGQIPLKTVWVEPRDKLRREKPRFRFAPLDSGAALLQKLQASLHRDLYLAFENDPAGEYRSWMVSEYVASISKGAKMVRRLEVLGLQPEELKESFRVVAPLQREAAATYYVRSQFDRCLVKHLQRLLGTSTGPAGLPLKARSLTALALLAERESEIQAYTPQRKWQIQVRLGRQPADGEPITATLHYAHGITDEKVMANAAVVEQAVQSFRHHEVVVHGISRSEFLLPPPPPFRLAELLQEAFLVHGYSPRQVLESLRILFDGVEIKGRTTGLVSSFLPLPHVSLAGLLSKIRCGTAKRLGANVLSETEPEDGIGEGYLLPLLPELEPDRLPAVLSEQEIVLYRLLWSRAMASQMRVAIGEKVEMELRAGEGAYFRASLPAIQKPGFLTMYQPQGQKELLEPCPLADLAEGQSLALLQIIPEQTGGSPPEFHTFSSLLEELGEYGMANEPSTILMLDTMLRHGYLTIMEQGALGCGENGRKVIQTMARALPSMPGLGLPAFLEQTVGEVVSGRKPFDFALRQFEQTLIMQGNVLVKFSMAPPPRQRPRKKTRSVIKAPEAKQVEESGMAIFPKPEERADPREVTGDPPVPLPTEQVSEEEAASLEGVRTVLPEAESYPEAEQQGVGPTEPAAADVCGRDGSKGPGRHAGPAGGLELVEPELTEQDQGQLSETAKVFEESPSGTEEDAATPSECKEQPQPVETGPQPDRKCPECGRPLVVKEDRFGRFWSCSGHPGCRFAESLEPGPKEPPLDCPVCGVGRVITKQTPTGKAFFVCPEPDCDFMAWSRPHAESCRLCSSSFLVERKTVGGKKVLVCPRAGCGYRQPLPGTAGEEEELQLPTSKKKVLVRRVVRKGGGSPGARKRRVVVRRK